MPVFHSESPHEGRGHGRGTSTVFRPATYYDQSSTLLLLRPTAIQVRTVSTYESLNFNTQEVQVAVARSYRYRYIPYTRAESMDMDTIKARVVFIISFSSG